VWWEYIIVAAVLLFGIYAFLVLTGFETRVLSRRTSRTAESMYGSYADSLHEQRRYARQHADEWKKGEGAQSRDPEDTQP
jgi:hypothetical protein